MAMKPRGVIALVTIVIVALAVSAGTLLAAGPSEQATRPTATIQIVAATGNAADPNVITVSLPDGKSTAKVGTTGLPNVPIGVTQAFMGSPSVQVTKYAWTLTRPSSSGAALSSTDSESVKLVPDVAGVYKVDLVVSNDAGSSTMASVQMRAGEYIGAQAGNCFQCHPKATDEWSRTAHANIFKDQINGGENPRTAEYGLGSEGCIRCHTTGYYPGIANGGFGDVWAQTGWQMPPAKDVQAGRDNWSGVPAALQNMANIQCEDCHGPAKDHVTKGTAMAASMDPGACNQCHDASAKHSKGTQLRSAGHSDASSQAWTYPVGPSRQDCVRCHSGKGYVSFLRNPTTPSAWDNSMQTVTCAVCHDSHSEANSWQLRIVGKPVEAAGITKDFGLSATCVECHNGRNTGADAAKGSTPHYSVAGEMLSDTGGVTYGQNVPNSPHGVVVGSAPMADPDLDAEIVPLFGRAVPGPCVACHMWPISSDAKDPNRFKVGGHSFNVVSPDDGSDYTASCQACHAGITNFGLAAKADYDGNGKVETVQAEVAGALNVLLKAINDSGVRSVQGHPYFDAADKAKANDKQKNAIYNYLFVRGLEGTDGRANAVHNFKRSIALLQLSYRDLTGKDMPNAARVQ